MRTATSLDELTCFALYSAAKVATSAYREALAEIGLTYTQYVTLLILWERDGQTVSELGESLHLDSGTLSPLLRRMAMTGLLERRRDDVDGRRVTIHLTETGRDLETRAAQIQCQMQASLAMDPEEVTTLRHLAQRFCESVVASPPLEGASR